MLVMRTDTETHSAMPLTISPARFEEIRRGVQRRRLVALVAEVEAIVSQEDKVAFATVDAFLAFADEHAADCPD